MSRPRIRVLVVDDSAFARKVLREVLSSAQIDVVGIIRNVHARPDAHVGLERRLLLRWHPRAVVAEARTRFGAGDQT